MKNTRKLILTGGILVLLISSWSFVCSVGKKVAHDPPAEEKIGENLPELPNFDCVRYEKNTILYPGDTTALYPFFESLQATLHSGGKTALLHLGGSHVQAGMLSNKVRENFISLKENNQGERGFFFPFQLANSNPPKNLGCEFSGEWEHCRSAIKEAECDWGMAALNATTKDDTAQLQIWSVNSSGQSYKFKSVRVFHAEDDTQFLPLAKNEAGAEGKITRMTNYTQFDFEELGDTLFLTFAGGQAARTHFTLQGIQMLNDQPGITYNAIGANGASVPSYLRCENFDAQAALVPSDLVIFGIGINDAYVPEEEFIPAQFEQEYLDLMAKLKAANPEVCFLFLTNNDSFYKRKFPNKNALEVQKVMYKIAEAEGAAVWDLFEIMGGLGSVAKWESAGLANKDKVHLTRAGYELQADMLFLALWNNYNRFLAATDHP